MSLKIQNCELWKHFGRNLKYSKSRIMQFSVKCSEPNTFFGKWVCKQLKIMADFGGKSDSSHFYD